MLISFLISSDGKFMESVQSLVAASRNVGSLGAL